MTLDMFSVRPTARPLVMQRRTSRTVRAGGRPACRGSRRLRILNLYLGLFASVLIDSPLRAEPFATPHSFAPQSIEQTIQPGFRAHGALRLAGRTPAGKPVAELSGLAWDDDEQLLYAISDGGYLLHLAPQIDNGHLTGVEVRAHFRLRDTAGEPLSGRDADAEGLAARAVRNGRQGDAELCISFEIRPRIHCYSAQGAFLSDLPLPVALRHRWRYRGANRQLESLAFLADGQYVTAPERALSTDDETRLWIYRGDGRRWSFKADDPHYSALVGLETLANDGLLALERRFVSPFHGIRFILHVIQLSDSATTPDSVRQVARFDNREGWALDNFEAVAHHTGNRYFMVSDDNRNPLQMTLLVYFALTDNAP